MAATLEQIRRVVTQYESSGAEKAAADFNAVAAAETNAARAGEKVATVTDTVTKKQISAARAVDYLRKSVDEAYRAEQNFIAGQRKLDTALAQGVITQEDHARTLDLLRTKYTTAKTANDNFSHGAADGAKLAAHEVQNLARQANDAATMLLSGSGLFQVIATQGGQVYDVLSGSKAGVSGALKEIGSGLLGLVTPARVAVGALAALGVTATVSYNQWAEAQQKLQGSLRFGQGRAFEGTIDDLNNLADAATAAGKVSGSQARVISGAFVETGRVSINALESLIPVTKDFADATGQELPDAAKELATAFAQPVRIIDDLDEKYNFLTAATRQSARELLAHNRVSDAQAILLRDLQANLPSATDKLTANARAWAEVGRWASNAYDALGRAVNRLVNGPTINESYVETLQKQLSAAQAQRDSGSMFTPWDINQRIKELEDALAAAQKALSQERDRANKAQQERTAKEADDASRTLNPQIEELERLTKLQAQLRAGLANPANNTDQYLMDLEGVRNRIEAITDSDGRLLTVSERLTRQRELEMAVIRAQTPIERANAEAALAAFKAKEQGATDAAAAATAEDARIKGVAQVYAQLTQAARERAFATEQAAAQQQLEIDLIGKTASEAALMRANFQSYWDLRREAAQNGTDFDEAEYQSLKKKNAEIAKGAQLAAEAKMASDIAFERSQLGRSDGDRQIASAQRSAGVTVDLNSANAEAMRLNQTLSKTQDIASSALSGFAQDLMNGTNAADALNNMLKRIASQLIDMAAKQLVAQAFGGLIGGGSSAPVSTSYGMTTGIYHSGGIIGDGAPQSRYVHPAYFENAPRFHSGFASDEFPAILQRGEAVFTAAQTRALGLMASGRQSVQQQGSNTFIDVKNYGPDRAQVRETKVGNDRYVEMVIGKAVNKNIARGGADGSNRARYGLTPAANKRG